MKMQRSLIAFILLACLTTSVGGEPAPLLKQLRDGEAAQHLTAAELAELGDPFFSIILKNNADLTNLSQIEKRIQPNPKKRHVFVVHENIVDQRLGQARRSIISFTGKGPDGIVLDTNVMISVFFDSKVFSDTPNAIEVWGWDAHRARYNYYKLDNSGTPNLQKTWKFRGSSVGADQLNRNDRRNSCMACHINGAPVMKELLFPWNNWHSDTSSSPANYLKAGKPNAWPVAKTERLRGTGADGGGLTDASKLEESIIAAIHQFNRRRINSALKRREVDGDTETRSDGTQTVMEGKRLLRHLFLTTEYNIISARRKSGLHALPRVDRSGPSGEVVIPQSFFLNSELIAGGGLAPGYRGLGISQAKSFKTFARIQPSEYKKRLLNSKMQLHSHISDANFSWFVPETSHLDNDMVDQLMKRGIISPQFVAATLTIDLETPILSQKRASLWRHVPDRFNFKPLKPNESHLKHFTHPDDLTQRTIKALKDAEPDPGSPQAKWLALLEDDKPIDRLLESVTAYRDRVKTNLADPQKRDAELDRLINLLIERRRAVNNDSVLKRLDETGGHRLFPLPPNS